MHRRIVSTLGAAGLMAVAVGGSVAAQADSTSAGDIRDSAAPAATVPVPSRYLNQSVRWSRCDSETTTECAIIRVPRDWNNPNARIDINIAVSRTLPEGASAERVVFGNPGGPGAPGLGMAPYLATRPGLKDHLAIGFDPRGTGSSTNVSCEGAPQWTMDPRDRSKANLDLTASAAKMWDPYCRMMSRGLRDYVTTEQTVKDIDLIRALLGYRQIDYVGYSGGTWMGAYYQKYFPSRVGRFVLDSNTDFTRPWNVTFEAQPQAFERRFRQDFATWAARYDARFGLGSTAGEVRGFYEELRADLKARPVDTGWFMFDQNALDYIIADAMYSKAYFQGLAQDLDLLRMLADENASSGPLAAQRRFDRAAAATKQRITEAAKGSRRPGLKPLAPDAFPATFISITCNDTPWPRGQAYLDRLSAEQGRRYPLIGWSVNQQPCGYWTRPPVRMPVPDGKGLSKTLMVQSVHDPATNESLARSAHSRYAGSVLVTVTKEGDHGIYGGVNPCVDTLVDRYLSTGAAPARDTTCVGTGIPAPVDPAERRAPSVSVLDKIDALSERIGRVG